MKQVAIYARVSTIDQNPEIQVKELKEYVEKNHEMELYRVYKDKTSGAKDSRPELNKLMTDARAHRFNHVVFWKVGRLGRNAIHVQTVANEWKKLGITFSITTMDIDTSSPVGRFIFGILAQFAEMERAMIRERTSVALKQIKETIKEEGEYKTKDGKVIKRLGRPKGSKDKKQRKKSGYYKRWADDSK